MLLWFYKWITRGLPFSGQLQANDKAYRLEPICTQGRIVLCRSVSTVIFIRSEFITPIEKPPMGHIQLSEENKITEQQLSTEITQVLQARIINSFLAPEAPDLPPISSGWDGRRFFGDDPRGLGITFAWSTCTIPVER